MRNVALAMVVVTCGCGEMPPGIDAGSTRSFRVRPVEQVLTLRGVELATRTQPVSIRSELGPATTVRQEADGAFVYDGLPAGPVLVEHDLHTFVYTARDSIEPCSLVIENATGEADSGVEVDVTLAQPAADGDSVVVSGSLPELRPQALGSADAGSLVLNQRVSWHGRHVLRGAVTALQLTSAGASGDFSRRVAVGALDAGTFTQQRAGTVSLQGAFTPLARAADQSLDWDDASLNTLGELFSATFSALRGQLVVASASAQARATAVVPLALPELAPDAFLVSGVVRFDLGESHDIIASYGWQGPWNGAPELKLRHRPATEVQFSADGARLSWAAPEVKPDYYVVSLEQQLAPRRVLHLGMFVTDETSVPIPLELQRPGMAAVVNAVTAPGLTVSGCAMNYRVRDSWALIPASSARWQP